MYLDALKNMLENVHLWPQDLKIKKNAEVCQRWPLNGLKNILKNKLALNTAF